MNKEKCYLVSASCGFVFSTSIIFKSSPSLNDIIEILNLRLEDSPIEHKAEIRNGKVYLGKSEVIIQLVEQEIYSN